MAHERQQWDTPVMLSHDEALLLYDLLYARELAGRSTEPQDDVEEWVMGCLTGSLELAVREDVFAEDYAQRVEEAKRRLRRGEDRP